MNKWVRVNYFEKEDVELLLSETNTSYLFEMSINNRFSLLKEKCTVVDWEPKDGELCLFWNDQKDVHLGKFKEIDEGYYFAYYFVSEKDGDQIFYEVTTSKPYKYCEPYVGFTPTIFKKDEK